MQHTGVISHDSDVIKDILKHAILAPSSHNTQPWHFKVSGQRIGLYADRTRALPVNDPDDRELTISCGCALLTLRIAAAQAGFVCALDLLPDPHDVDLLASVELSHTQATRTRDVDLFKAIRGRRTYRKRFESRTIPDSTLTELDKAAEEESAWLQVVTAEPDRQALAVLIAEGDAMLWANPSWRRELAAWMHPRRKGDGLTVPGLVVPLTQAVVRTFDMGNGVGARDKQLADASPVLAILGTQRDGVADWLRAGQALQRILLRAYLRGLQGSFLNQPVQVAALRPKLQEQLGLTGYAQIVLRFGFPEQDLPAAPRRALDEVIE